MQQGLLYNKEKGQYYIRELEVSIHNICNLRCNECGFNIPSQLLPYISDPIEETLKCLNVFKKHRVHIGNLVVVGGEPLLKKNLLENAVKAFKSTNSVETLEVVSNGFFPEGLSKEALNYIDYFTLSKYFSSDELVDLWRKHISLLAPKTKFRVREKPDGWEKWWGEFSIDAKLAQKNYDRCFYRRHCITFERGRLFPCSRIAKEGNDAEGLPLLEEISFQQIESFLNSPVFFPSCLKCTPMMGLPKVKVGIQPDNRIEKLTRKAIAFFNKTGSI